MSTIRVCEDIADCTSVWGRLVPQTGLFDLWDVRACFQRHFRHRPYFLVAEGPNGPRGLLPLSYLDESESYGYFPGETWSGKTWLEQNRLYGDSAEICQELLDNCPPETHLRYLVPETLQTFPDTDLDEVGYLFYPARYGFEMENYWQEFSGKGRKKLQREIDEISAPGLSVRENCFDDVQILLEMNLRAFGERSYFLDERFRGGFGSLMAMLHERGWLRITTVLLGGEVAAVDVGGVYNNAYTVLAGGTDGRFQGVAKVINLQHLAWACRQRLESVDFLCGSFGWKDRFHLTPRPLYQIKISAGQICHQAHAVAETVGDVA